MISTLAVHGYRSLHDLVMPLAPVTLVTGENGAGKSSLYRALRLLASTASTGVVEPLARDGGLQRVLWAGPGVVSRAMRMGEVPVQGGASRKKPISLMMGVVADDLGYLVDIGLPTPSTRTRFARDPLIKREEVFVPPALRPAGRLVTRKAGRVVVHGDGRQELAEQLSQRTSMLSEFADPHRTPELLVLRRLMQGLRFYDSFRTDTHAPARGRCLTTWTPVLAEDGHDLAAALATIQESAWAGPLAQTVERGFPGTELEVNDVDGELTLLVHQPGMLRPLSADELSDGTLRFLLLAAALLSPQPPQLLVLNEPETSLHPQVLPVLAQLVLDVARRTQVLVVSHSRDLIEPLAAADRDEGDFLHHHLVKDLGVTTIEGQGLFSRPQWDWGSR